MKVFCCYLKDALSKKFSSTPTYWFEKRRDIHFAFKIPISKYESFDRLTDFILNECENRNIFFRRLQNDLSKAHKFIQVENMLSIHIEMGNFFNENYDTN